MSFTFDSNILSEAVYKVLVSEESFLHQFPENRSAGENRSTRQYREYDIQFMLWRELVCRSFNAFLEDKRRDVTVYDGLYDGSNLRACIEIKGPWDAEEAAKNPRCLKQCLNDFKRQFRHLQKATGCYCYCLWLLRGPDKCTIEKAFKGIFNHARSGANGEYHVAELMPLNPHPLSSSRVLQAYIIDICERTPAE
jgi:hypothetical protein